MKYLLVVLLVVLVGCDEGSPPANARMLLYGLSHEDIALVQEGLNDIDHLEKEIKYLKQRVSELEMSSAIVTPVPIPMRYPVRPELYYLKSFLPWALQPDNTRDTFFAHCKYRSSP